MSGAASPRCGGLPWAAAQCGAHIQRASYMARRWLFVLGCAVGSTCVGAACSAPATLPALAQAEALERTGNIDEAQRAYQRAQHDCLRLAPAERRALACAQAALGEAELLDHAGRPAAAIAAYRRVVARQTEADQARVSRDEGDEGAPRASGRTATSSFNHPHATAVAARAGYRGGALLLAANDAAAAYALWWHIITQWPNEPTSGDILATLVRDARGRAPDALYEELLRLVTPLAETAVADNLLWWLADLARQERHAPDVALAYFDRIYTDYPQSGMRDDARWFAAQMALDTADAHGAVTRLRGLLATREVAFGTGSYFSIWLDDAQLLLGRVLRDHLHDSRGALQVWRGLAHDYPASVLRDDALYEIVQTHRALREDAAACRALSELRSDFPDSKYLPKLPPCQDGQADLLGTGHGAH